MNNSPSFAGLQGTVHHPDHGSVLGDGGSPHCRDRAAPPGPVPGSGGPPGRQHGQELPQGQQHAVCRGADDGRRHREVEPSQEDGPAGSHGRGLKAKVVRLPTGHVIVT